MHTFDGRKEKAGWRADSRIGSPVAGALSRGLALVR